MREGPPKAYWLFNISRITHHASRLIQLRMLLMKSSRILVCFCKREQRCFAEQFANKADARGSAGFAKAIGQNHAGISGEVAHQQVLAREARSDIQIHLLE